MPDLTEEETVKLKTLCEFLFYDNYQYWATFSRFEKCFQPLFNNIKINLYEVFISIVGKQKKYITYTRFVRAFMKYKKYEIEKDTDLYIFFDLILNKILKSINAYVGHHEEYSYLTENICSFSTKKARHKGSQFLDESFISQIHVLNDKNDRLKGLIIEYDDIVKYNLYPKDLKKKLYIGLEINLDIINKDSFIRKKKLNEDINLSLYRDSVTHIFGTYNKEKKIISFLGFKCISGKTRYIGIPDGDPFLFGEFGKKFYNLRLEMDKKKGITLFEPGFIENKRKNYHLNKVNNKKMKLFCSKMQPGGEETIMDEKYLKVMTGDKLNQYITTSIMDDGGFSGQQTKEKISGYDYKEVVNQNNRDWIKNKYKGFGNYFSKIIFKETNLLFNIKKEDKIMRKSTRIEKIHDEDIYSFNPSQNPFYKNKDNPNKKKARNPFFVTSNIGKKLVEGLILHQHTSLIKEKEEEPQKSFLTNAETIKNIKGKIAKDTKPFLFLNSKNFNNLKEELSSLIYKQFYLQYYKKNNINSKIPFIILNEFVPYQEETKIQKENKNNQTKKNRLLKTKGKPIEINDEEISEIESEQNNKEENFENTISSDGSLLKKYVDFDQLGKIKEKNNIKKRSSIHKNDPVENWKLLTRHISFFFGIKLLQTIRRIIIAMNSIFKEDISLEERIKYYNILTDPTNEKIINFLSEKQKKDDDDNEDNDEIYVLDKNPEMYNSLENLDKEINNLKNQNLDENRDEESEIKSKKELNYYIQQKNILIENITNKDKEQLMENYNYRGFIFEEKRKRTSWVQDDERKLTGANFFDSQFQEVERIDEYEDITKISFHRQDFNFKDGKDPIFFPCKESLCPLMEDKKHWKLPDKVLNSDIENWELINWDKCENIKRIFYSNNSLPLLDNIRQGEYIGDCYFLSALGSLCNDSNEDTCQKGSHLKNLIKLVKRDKIKNIYSVKLNINGIWKYVLVDNYFPFILNNNGKLSFCFGSSFKRELWVSLFEKAWAKINGCYARISSGGYCGEAFDALTDAYTELIHIQGYADKKDILWNELIIAKNNNYVMCAGSKRFGLFENAGLVSSHAYTLMNLYELKEEGLKLVKLRNPWGEKEFIGDWSDKSSKWTDEIKKKVDFEEDKDDGIFYMSYDDFVKYYEILEILKMKEGYGTVASCKIKKTEAYKCQIIKFELKEKRHIFINLYQKNSRIVRKNGTYFPKSVKSFIILAQKEFQNKYRYIKSMTSSKVHIGMEVDLDAGIYYIFCDVNYRFVYDEFYGYNITIYSNLSQGEINLSNITNTFNGKKRSEILGTVLYSYYDLNKKNKKFTKINNSSGIEFYKLNNFNEEFPFIILLFLNPKMENIFLNCTLKYESTEKNVCIYNDSEASEFDKQIIKNIKNDFNVLLLMGYQISDRFSFSFNFSDIKKTLTHMVFNNKYKIEKEAEENFMYYVSFTENRRGCILGLERTKGERINMNIKLKGLNVIDPYYDDLNKIEFLKDNIQNIKFNMGEGEKMVFNLRFKADCEDFDYEIEH